MLSQNCREHVTVLGFFDGIHLGHKKLITEARECAQRLSISTAVFTFSSLPTKDKSERRILTRSERESVLASLGVDFIYESDFESVKDMDASSFVTEILIKKMHTRVAFCGEGFKFGRGAEYSATDLAAELEKHGRKLYTVGEEKISGEKISSSEIKNYIENGEIERANSLLCEPYFISASVIHGRGVGRKLGFPTVNCDIPEEKVFLKNGVYKTELVCDGELYRALTNVGTCPTFEERRVHVESYLLNFEGDLYQKDIKIRFLEYLRDEIKFENEEKLILQIQKDVERALR